MYTLARLATTAAVNIGLVFILTPIKAVRDYKKFAKIISQFYDDRKFHFIIEFNVI